MLGSHFVYPEQVNLTPNEPWPVRAELARRIEEASINAWPALQQHVFDGWLLRFARGFTKRANCIVPLYKGTLPIADKVAHCEAQYQREALRTIFRLHTLQSPQELDAMLAERRYERMDETLVLHSALGTTAAAPAIELLTAEAWLEIYGKLTGIPPDAARLHALIVQNISLACAFAVVREGQRAVACGLGVLDHEYLGVFDIVTAPQARRRGYARAMLSGLHTWGAAQGARHAYLQVVASNLPARRLYDAEGMAELYRCWYRAST